MQKVEIIYKTQNKTEGKDKSQFQFCIVRNSPKMQSGIDLQDFCLLISHELVFQE